MLDSSIGVSKRGILPTVCFRRRLDIDSLFYEPYLYANVKIIVVNGRLLADYVLKFISGVFCIYLGIFMILTVGYISIWDWTPLRTVIEGPLIPACLPSILVCRLLLLWGIYNICKAGRCHILIICFVIWHLLKITTTFQGSFSGFCNDVCVYQTAIILC